MAPGCGDAISARLIEATGFESAYMSGAWTAAARGFQDYGLVTLQEMVQNAHDMARAVSIPVCIEFPSWNLEPWARRRIHGRHAHQAACNSTTFPRNWASNAASFARAATRCRSFTCP